VSKKTLGKYEVVERIGRGGMAEVYKGYHAALDRFVAIKLLHPFLADDPEFKERFEKEAKNVARLRHPNIVQVFDFEYDENGESYYMIMEFINGPTLKDKLFDLASNDQMFSMEETIRLISDAASALDYAHKRNMIHRDVKPANLMIDEDDRLVLTDFGIAKMVTGAQFTASGGMVGTPAYMAPEQGLGEAGDERSDIYSLGVIFYQMVTGRLPYDADTPLAVILKHVNEPLPDLHTIKPDLPSNITNIILKAMAKAPEERYQSASEMVDELRHNRQRVSPQDASTPSVKGPSTRELLAQADESRQKATSAKVPSTSIFESTVRKPGTTSRTGLTPPPPPRSATTSSTTTGAEQTPPGPPRDNISDTAAQRQQGAPNTTMLWAAIGIITLAIILVVLAMLGRDGEGPLAVIFEADEDDVTEVGETMPSNRLTETAIASSNQTATQEANFTPSLTASYTVTPSPTNTATEMVSPSSTYTSTPSLSPTPTIDVTAVRQTNTAVAAITQAAARTATAEASITHAFQATQTSIAGTEQAAGTATASAEFATATVEAASAATATARALIVNCRLDYVVNQPVNIGSPPPISATVDRRLLRAGEDFTFDIVIENASSCDWPLDAGLEMVFLNDTVAAIDVDDETPEDAVIIDYSQFRTNCNDPDRINYNENLTTPRRPSFVINQRVEQGETFTITFSGEAPASRGCYFGAWQLQFGATGYDFLPISEPIVIGVQVFGGN
jgi:serine/threonine-protein kinase